MRDAALHASSRLSVVLVRERAEATTGGCGRQLLDNPDLALGPPVFAERRDVMVAMGPLYRAIRARFGDGVELLVVDPRNVAGLGTRLVRDFVRFRVGWRAAWGCVSGLSTPSVVVNGRLVARGTWPEPEAFVALLEARRRVPEAPVTDWRGVLRHVGGLLREFYTAPYRGAVARARRDEDDLLMLFVYAEAMGVQNPAQFHLLELQPLLLERFHDWHLRMGMDHSPLDHFRCC